MKFIDGDIAKAAEDHIIHGCNAQGVMGKGVAKALRDAFPGNYETYRDDLKEHIEWAKKTFPNQKAVDNELLGLDFVFFHKESMKTIHNLITQIDYDRYSTGGKFASYLAIANGVQQIVKYNFAVDRYAISMIGCNLGGLKWAVVEELLKEVEEHGNVEFTVYRL